MYNGVEKTVGGLLCAAVEVWLVCNVFGWYNLFG